MTSSTTPQDRVVELITSFIAREVNADSAVIGFVRLQAIELAEELADAGLLSSAPLQEDGVEVSSLRSEPSAVDEPAVYVLLSGRQVSYTVEHYNGAVMVDMDDYNEPVGVEILDAREVTIGGHPVHVPKASGEAAKEKA